MKTPIKIPIDMDARNGAAELAFDLDVTPAEASELLDWMFDSLYYDHEDN